MTRLRRHENPNIDYAMHFFFQPIMHPGIMLDEIPLGPATLERSGKILDAVLFGSASALSLGVADFVASRNTRFLGTLRATRGMFFVSVIVLIVALGAERGVNFFATSYPLGAISLAVIHGITSAAALASFFHAMSTGKIGVAAPVFATNPIFILSYYWILDGMPGLFRTASMVLVIFGVGLVALSERGARASSLGHSGSRVIALSMASSFLYAISIIALQATANDLPALDVMLLARMSGLLCVSALIVVQVRRGPPLERRRTPVVLHGVLDVAGFLLILFGTARSGDPSLVALISSLFPVVTVILAIVFLKESLSLQNLAGLVIIAAGVAGAML